MYVTAQRVETPDGRRDIHGFLHRHGDIRWPEDVSAWPQENPGDLVFAEHAVDPGGNAVLSYLDVLAPDETCTETVREVLGVLAADLGERRNPTVLESRPVTIIFGVAAELEPAIEAELATLAETVLRALGRHGGLLGSVADPLR